MIGTEDEEQSRRLLAPTPRYLASLKVFPLILRLRKDVVTTIDSALSWEQLTASDINFAVVRPLVFKYAKLDNMAVVYACFVVRSHLLAEAEENIAYAGVLLSRAALCEILAMKLLGHYASSDIRLAAVLTASWNPLAGAPADVEDEVRHAIGGEDVDPQSALEMAIATEAKQFISSPLVQSVVNDIYNGRVVFSMMSMNSVLADNYKPRTIDFYDVGKAPILDHYRLRVPRYCAILEFLNFVVLLVLFLLALSTKDLENMTPFEIAFAVFVAAFALDEYTASKEHGWDIYIASIWNLFDTAFIVISAAFFGLRIRGLLYHDHAASELAFDILACGACVLFPRLAFFAVKNNVVVLALRAMAADFIFFIGIAAICFSGLLFTLHSLAAGKWSVKSIAWLMVQIWFGNTYLSFGQAESFHPVFGPILMTCFAALSNTLLITILISILSNTFARIDANANKEYLFQYAISTIEGVKSDALFSYQPPFNLLAFLILWPLSRVLTPRALHTANVFLIRLTSFPTLIVITVYERFLSKGQRLRDSGSGAVHDMYSRFSRKVRKVPFLERLVGASTTDLYDAIFDADVSHLGQGLGLFEDSDEEDALAARPRLRSQISRESLRPHPRPPSPSPSARAGASADALSTALGAESSLRRARSAPHSPRAPSSTRKRQGSQTNLSPRRKYAGLPALLEPSGAGAAEVPSAGPLSPLGRLFTGRREFQFPAALSHEKLHSPTLHAAGDASVRRLEALVEDIRQMPVNKLKEEIKELQDRQARIENLLLMLTRGMRNETFAPSSIRHDTL